MRDLAYADQLDLSNLTMSEWLDALNDLDSDDIFVEYLEKNHGAVLQENGPVLIVTFETYSAFAKRESLAHPLGWDIANRFGWSSLTILCDQFDWFRSKHIYAYFDRLVGDGTIDQFERAIFLGIGETSHSAAAFSLVATHCDVVLFGPIASLATDVASWDTRFPAARRLDFTSRFGYAPSLVETAQNVYMFYDKSNPVETMHATLFKGENINRFAAPLQGIAWGALTSRPFVIESLKHIVAGADAHVHFTHLRGRRRSTAYLRKLLLRAQQMNRPWMVKIICEHTLSIYENAPRFIKALEAANHALSNSAQDT